MKNEKLEEKKAWYFSEYLLRKLYASESSLKMSISNGNYITKIIDSKGSEETIKVPVFLYEKIFKIICQVFTSLSSGEASVCFDIKKAQNGIFYFKINEEGDSVFDGSDYEFSPNKKVDFKNRPKCYKINTCIDLKDNSYLFEIKQHNQDMII